ncbi:unnamed protein product [Vitrella brassicaformis CCMP3155]|uniref:C3H1-type domain-containing protein n=1 Tax=Vitrella brassicaformis (strain CCMP3155) TaxID=1169540 RepID=A0A0G4GVQ2_VITBC|nr:unnamed protein product [Vitrella brassicaformis CCMP3155]|eukprot:CEM34901.1 unnamed protein product [Vitrella brassicaformis CCMP3155]
MQGANSGATGCNRGDACHYAHSQAELKSWRALAQAKAPPCSPIFEQHGAAELWMQNPLLYEPLLSSTP